MSKKQSILSKLFKKNKPDQVNKNDRTAEDVERFQATSSRFGRKSVFSKSRHYKDIRLSADVFPQIRLENKPSNKEDFLRFKERYIDDVFEVVRGYYDYVANLPGVGDDEELKRLLHHVIREFIKYFWDMPASKEHHHTGRFGLLVHSLRVACEEAEKGADYKLWTQSGLDKQRMLKEKGDIILAHFFAGLFHDAHKVHDYKLVFQGPYGKNEYDPHRGGVLNFNMVNPAHMDRKEGWEKQPQNLFHYNIAIMVWMVGWDFFSKMKSAEVFQYCLGTMVLMKEGQDEADSLDAAAGSASDPSQALHFGILDALNSLFRETPENCGMYRLSNDWFAIHYASFTNKVARKTSVFANNTAVANYLGNIGALASKLIDGSARNSEKMTYVVTYSDGNTKRIKDSGLAFMSREYAQNILDHIASEQSLQPQLPVLAIEKKMFPEDSLLACLNPMLPEDCFVDPPTPPLEAEKQEQKPEEKQPSQPQPEPVRKPQQESANFAQKPQQQGALVNEPMEAAPGHEEKVCESLPHDSEPKGERDEAPESKASAEELLQAAQEATAIIPPAPEEESPTEEDAKEYDYIQTPAGEVLDAEGLLKEVLRVLGDNPINTNSKDCLAFFVLDAETKSARFYIKFRELLGQAMHIGPKTLKTSEGREATLKAVHLLHSEGFVVDATPQRLKGESYFAMDDLAHEKPIPLDKVLAVQMEWFSIKEDLRSLRQFVETHAVEV